MSGEETISKADILLRPIPSVKTSNVLPPLKKFPAKEELQFLRISDQVQEQIMDTLYFIHGPDFKLAEASSYKQTRTNLGNKFWATQGSLVIKGVQDFSRTTHPEFELDRLKQFALARLESYGFHKTHCFEAMQICEESVEDALYLLHRKYFADGPPPAPEEAPSERELLEQREDERSALESIYESAFSEKVQNEVWILTFKLDYLVSLYHRKPAAVSLHSRAKQKEKCRNFIRGQCKYGGACRFSHAADVVERDPNAHLTDFYFELEIRFPPNTKYPYEPPMIFLKTNAVLPPLVGLHICHRLHEEARGMAEDGISSVYAITELLLNKEEITEHLKKEPVFLAPNVSLFPRMDDILKVKRPSHYIKGITGRGSKKALSWREIKLNDEKLIEGYLSQLKSPKYLSMLQKRKSLPAWALMNDILNTIQKSQVCVISGETGCGKSTQVPQFIFDDWIINYASEKRHIEIVCTQPRRISAIGVAERVADERCSRVGHSVGYQIRLESKVSAFTRLTFCTTGILLRRLEGEPTLSNVTHIIVDEVHERSEESDFLLLILKELLPIRPDLKVILMSATLNAQLFSDYFGEIPILDIPGRTFPVEQHFLEDIYQMTGYVLEDGSEYARKIRKNEVFEYDEMTHHNIINNYMPKDNIKDETMKYTQFAARYRTCNPRTWRNLYLTDVEVINNELIEAILMWIVDGEHDYPRKGTILIFLPGIAEITNLYDQLLAHREFNPRGRKYVIYPLHSSLTSEEQAQIFRKPKNGERKIVLSTNLAETSVTIDDCVYVIDSGKMKEKHFDPNRNMESLETVWVTRANAQQRKGRAGRVMPGVCFHLYTSNRFRHQMLAQPIPEIHRIPLEQLILNIRVLANFGQRQVAAVMNAFIEPPVAENIETALVRLQDVGALDKEGELTPLGHHLAALPVDVRIGKLMLYGAIFSCVDAALTMAACLSHKSPFVTPFLKKDEANKKKRSFAIGNSDQLTALVAYRKWLSIYKRSPLAGRNFANESFLSHRTLQTIADIKHQFLEFLVDIGFIAVDLDRRRQTGQDDVFTITGNEFNKYNDNINVLQSILCAALYPNIVKVLTPAKSFVKTASGGAISKEHNPKDLKYQTPQENVFMHPSSVNYIIGNFVSPFLVYQEKVRTSKVYFRDCTMVPIIPLVLFSGFDLDINVHNYSTFISLERRWIMFQVEEHKIAEMIKMIKQELFVLLEEKIKDPLLNLMHDEKGERIISTILNMIK